MFKKLFGISWNREVVPRETNTFYGKYDPSGILKIGQLDSQKEEKYLGSLDIYDMAELIYQINLPLPADFQPNIRSIYSHPWYRPHFTCGSSGVNSEIKKKYLTFADNYRYWQSYDNYDDITYDVKFHDSIKSCMANKNLIVK